MKIILLPPYSSRNLKLTISALAVASAVTTAQGALVHLYDASSDVAGNSSWTDEQGSVNLSFTGGSTSPVDVSGNSNYFTAAYQFGGAITGGFADRNWNTIVNGSTSYEMWIRPDGIPSSDRQTLLEIGNPFSGLSFALDTDGSVLGLVKDGGHSSLPDIVLNSADISSQLTSGEFVQIVLTVDKFDPGDGTDTKGTLYVNGAESASFTYDGNLDLNNTNPGGIARFYYDQLGGGQRDSGIYAQSTFSNYEGQIALTRIYDSALTSGEVQAAYDDIAIPEPNAFWLVTGVGGALLYTRRLSRKTKA